MYLVKNYTFYYNINVLKYNPSIKKLELHNEEKTSKYSFIVLETSVAFQYKEGGRKKWESTVTLFFYICKKN